MLELQNIPDNSVDVIITSPPYFRQRKYTTQDFDEEEVGTESKVSDYIKILLFVFGKCFNKCKPTGSIVFNLGDKYIDGSLQLIPYRFAIQVLDNFSARIVNDITWIKANPTPKPHKRRLVNTTESFFHFVKSKDYYYNMDAWEQDIWHKEHDIFAQDHTHDYRPRNDKKGKCYCDLIKKSDLSESQRAIAYMKLREVKRLYNDYIIDDFRMKIKGIHKPAFGGQQGGRNSEMEKNGFTIIKMYGKPMKRDIINSPVANTKNIDHPAVFPLEVIKQLISLLSKEGDIVLDPFNGSGTVCVAAKQLNRKYIGIDINPDYCKKTEERLLKC